MTNKTQGWEKRLADYLFEVKDKPFKRGAHDCALFAGRCVDIMTGSDTVTEFLHPYESRAEAYEMLKTLGYDGLEAIANKKLGEPLPLVSYAGRGDCVLLKVDDHEALGIVDLSGRFAVTIGLKGLVHMPPAYWEKAWKV